jgi:hypothetical protein
VPRYVTRAVPFFTDTLSDDVANSLPPATAVAPYPNCEALDTNGTCRDSRGQHYTP